MTATVIVVQARSTSTRLPGKVLLPLAGRSVLWHVLTRCRAVPGVDAVVCAIPDSEPDPRLAAEAKAAGATVVAGSESDVLARFLAAARAVDATTVMRVTSDCPVIDPAICRLVLDALTESGADYACNNVAPRTWPHGLDCEAFTRAALERAALEASQPEDFEHVTPWLRRAADVARVAVTGPGGPAASLRWTLDYPEDYAFFEALFARLPAPPALPGQDEILALLARHPEIAALNAARATAV